MKKIGLLCVIVCVFFTLGYAREEGRRRGAMPKEIIEQLQLTPTQTAQMQAQHESEQQAMAGKFAEIKKLHDALDKELTSAVPNDVQIATIIQSIKDTQLEIATIHFDGLLEIRQILTPEQFKKMIMMRQKFKVKMEKKWGERVKQAMDAGLHKQGKDDKQDPPPPPPEGAPLF